MSTPKPPQVRQNFVAAETCFSLIAQYHTAVLRGELSPPKRRTTAVPLRDVAARVKLPQCCGVPDLDLRSLRDNVVNLMEKEWGFTGLLPDFTAYTTTQKGGAHELHADNCMPDGSPNHTAWRAVTAILYLNTGGHDFAGGEIVFPEFGLTIVPQPGLLVSFPCVWYYRHQVPAVTRGERHALVFWTTQDASHAEQWPAVTKPEAPKPAAVPRPSARPAANYPAPRSPARPASETSPNAPNDLSSPVVGEGSS